MGSDPFYIQVHLSFSKAVFTDDPEFIATNIKYDPVTTIAQQIRTGESLFDVSGCIPVCYFQRVHP